MTTVDTDLRAKVLALIKRNGRGGTCHGEMISKLCGGDHGDCFLTLPGNVQMCHGLPERLALVLDDLLNVTAEVRISPTSLIIYGFDGSTMHPRLPHVETLVHPGIGGETSAAPEGGFDEPHQIMVIWRPRLPEPEETAE